MSGKRDSNSRPQPWQGCALPTELFPQFPLCPRQESNLHVFQHSHLKRARLPFRHVGLVEASNTLAELRVQRYCFSQNWQNFSRLFSRFSATFFQKAASQGIFARLHLIIYRELGCLYTCKRSASQSACAKRASAMFAHKLQPIDVEQFYLALLQFHQFFRCKS